MKSRYSQTNQEYGITEVIAELEAYKLDISLRLKDRADPKAKATRAVLAEDKAVLSSMPQDAESLKKFMKLIRKSRGHVQRANARALKATQKCLRRAPLTEKDIEAARALLEGHAKKKKNKKKKKKAIRKANIAAATSLRQQTALASIHTGAKNTDSSLKSTNELPQFIALPKPDLKPKAGNNKGEDDDDCIMLFEMPAGLTGEAVTSW